MRRSLARAGWVALLAAAMVGCADLLVDAPPDDPVAVFDQLWTEFDRLYGAFDVKDVDWNALYDRYRPEVGPGTSPARLFAVLTSMLDSLRDGHVMLAAPFATYWYTGWRDGVPESYVAARVATLLDGGLHDVGAGVRYGRAGGVGYVHVASMNRPAEAAVDAALAALAGVDAMILDVRDNPGGSDVPAVAIAGRFADRAYHYQSHQYRNGPAHDDFTPLAADSVYPAGPLRFGGPVAVLTNRAVFSAAETFVLAMRAQDGVTVVGDTTGGGSGNPMMRELANGWTYQVPRWRVLTPAGATFEGRGLVPAHVVQFRPGAVPGDPVLDSALVLLNNARPAPPARE